MNEARLRFLLTVPCLLLILSGAVMVVMALLAWGAAAHVEVPDWMTTFTGLVFATTALAIGGLTLREVRRQTAVGFDSTRLHLPLGAALCLGAAAIFAVAARISDSSTYDSFRDESGKIRTSSGLFLVTSVLGDLVIGALVAACAYVYAQSFSRNQSRFTKRSDEPDAMGRLLDERGRD